VKPTSLELNIAARCRNTKHFPRCQPLVDLAAGTLRVRSCNQAQGVYSLLYGKTTTHRAGRVRIAYPFTAPENHRYPAVSTWLDRARFTVAVTSPMVP